MKKGFIISALIYALIKLITDFIDRMSGLLPELYTSNPSAYHYGFILGGLVGQVLLLGTVIVFAVMLYQLFLTDKKVIFSQ